MNQINDLLNVLWSQLDSANHGFIYGKDLPILIEKTLLAIDDKDKIDPDKISLLKKFAKDQAYVKIVKVALDDTLLKLVGKRYDGIVGNSKIVHMPASITKNSTSIPLSQKTDPDEIKQLKKEIIEKENIIKSKEKEMTKLQESISHYKKKYNGLVEEFKYYKQTIEKKEVTGQQQPKNALKNEDQSSSKRNFDLRNEFFIEEFKRQIDEQTKIINKLKTQIESSPSLRTQRWNKKPQYTSSLRQNIPIFISRQYIWFLIIISLLGLVSSIYFKFKSNYNQINDVVDGESSWIHTNPLTNSIRWLVSVQNTNTNEDDSDYISMSEQDIDAYNQIFARGANII